MGRCLPFAAVLLLIPALAAAQTSRDDAIRALARGDYEAAARILRPLADNASQPDPAAQFLLAILYDTGHGVARNTFHSCSLFLDAAKPANPLMQHASQLSGLVLEQLGPMGSQFCVSGVRWPDNPPTTLTLGPKHSVTITDTSVTVSYDGAENRMMEGLLPGMVALPARYTPLDVSSPVSMRRHFIQRLFWWPDQPAQPSTWRLGWILSEVVGKDLISVTGDRSLLTVTGAQPPASIDLTSLAQVRVNANGEAEWVISGGTNPPKRDRAVEGSALMRWVSLFIASWLTVSMSQAPAAQAGTAEGVAALARGDAQQAAAILKPIAEGWGKPDPMAQFFMGTLYETGQGVPQDLLRACALYSRASTTFENPFGVEAGTLMKALFRAHGPEWFEDCQILANVGFDHRFEPVTLTLTPGHSVAWDLKGATVTYQGKSTHFPMRLATTGTIFFPIRQIDLPSGDPAAPYRYFHEVLLGRPSEDQALVEPGVAPVRGRPRPVDSHRRDHGSRGDARGCRTAEPAILRRARVRGRAPRAQRRGRVGDLPGAARRRRVHRVRRRASRSERARSRPRRGVEAGRLEA